MRAVVLSIQEDCIKLLTADGQQVTGWNDTPLPHGLVENGVVTDPTALAQRIKTLLKEQAPPRAKIAVCLSGTHCIPRIFSLPQIKRQLRDEAVRRQCERRMPVPLDQLYLSWQLLDSEGTQDRYFVVAVPRRSVQSLVETMALAGIRDYVLDIKPLALARAVNAPQSVILNVEQDNADIVLMVNGVPEIMRTMPVKKDSGSKQDALTETGIAVVRTIDYYNSRHPDRGLDPATPLFLLGGGARDPSAQALLARVIGVRPTPAAPLLKCPPPMPAEEYSANVGLVPRLYTSKNARQSAPFPALSMQFSTHSYQPPRHLTRKLFSVGMASLALVLLVFLVQATGQARAETALVSQELAVMDEQLRDAVKARAPLDNLNVKLERLSVERLSVLGSDGRFAERLDLVLGHLPDGMVPDSVSMTSGSMTVEGEARDFSQVIGFTRQLEKSPLFSAVYLESLSAPKATSSSGATFRIWAEY